MNATSKAPATVTPSPVRTWNDDDVYVVDLNAGTVVAQYGPSERRRCLDNYRLQPGQGAIKGSAAKYIAWLQ